jgi:ribosomal protein L29
MTKAAELRTQSDAELSAMELELQDGIFQTRCAIALRNSEAKPQDIRKKRKDIARIKTIRRERQMKGA